VLAVCDCPEDFTGRVTVSLDLVASMRLEVKGLDGGPWTKP
jgi:hypothetical protein